MSDFDDKITELKQETLALSHRDDMLQNAIDNKLFIAEYTNIFLDLIFILLSFVLWIVTMSGWRNQKEITKDRKRFAAEHDKIIENITKDRKRFKSEYEQHLVTSEDAKKKAKEEYLNMKLEHDAALADIKGTAEYYLELVSISHEPDLQDKMFEYEKLLRNANNYGLSSDEKARVHYYMALTTTEIAIKNKNTNDKLYNDNLKKASKCIDNAILLDSKREMYYYERGKISLEKYSREIKLNGETSDFTITIYGIEECFEQVIKLGEMDFYIFEEIINNFYNFAIDTLTKESDKRILYDIIISWCERAASCDKERYDEDLSEIRKEVDRLLEKQNQILDDDTN